MFEGAILAIGWVSSVVGVFSILDITVNKKSKDDFAEYLFGFRHRAFDAAFSNILDAFLGWFLKEERVVPRRVYAFSVSISILVSAFVLLAIATVPENRARLTNIPSHFIGLLFISISCLFSFPADYTFTRFAKFLFYRSKRGLFLTFLKVLLFLTTGYIAFLIFILSFGFFGFVFETIHSQTGLESPKTFGFALSAWFLIFLASSIPISILSIGFIVTVVSISALFGTAIRLIMRATRLNYLFMDTNLPNHPFSFLGMIFGTVVYFM